MNDHQTPQSIADLAKELDALESRDDDVSWDKASTYVDRFSGLMQEPAFKHKHGQAQARLINNALRRTAADLGLRLPRPSFLAHAKKLADTWPAIFGLQPKLLTFHHYRRLAVSSLPLADKDRLRAWAEQERPTQEELRQRIREEVDARNSIYKPDFELKTSNYWKFNSLADTNGYGAIHGLIYANLVYWFSEPGDVILDPMAGTGTLGKVLGAYRFYCEEYEAEGSGRRIALMSDIAPTNHEIIRSDAKHILPFEAESVDLAIIDPPYLRIADDKVYSNIGDSKEEWLKSIRLIVTNVVRCLKPSGKLALITDDVLRGNEHCPIAFHATDILADAGMKQVATIYNNNPNYVYTMGPAQMLAARRDKLLCNGCKVIQVARKVTCTPPI